MSARGRVTTMTPTMKHVAKALHNIKRKFKSVEHAASGGGVGRRLLSLGFHGQRVEKLKGIDSDVEVEILESHYPFKLTIWLDDSADVWEYMADAESLVEGHGC